jgi:uncharacterized protein (TIGR00730 family)
MPSAPAVLPACGGTCGNGRNGEKMKICVYCSSSKKLNGKYYAAGLDFGRALARRGHSLIYGGYGEGIMGQVARGVSGCGGKITAVVPRIFDRPDFIYGNCAEIVKTADMRSRKQTMECLADCFAVLPGGIGTLDEMFEACCLNILGELKKPLGILNTAGFYDPLREMMEKCAREGFLNYGNAELRFFDTAEALLDALEASAGGRRTDQS